uniref:Uncharacterized protein n=1 Tax=Solanum lycopersicum TaxID=4081 RepID=K4CDV4_SOLLC
MSRLARDCNPKFLTGGRESFR